MRKACPRSGKRMVVIASAVWRLSVRAAKVVMEEVEQWHRGGYMVVSGVLSEPHERVLPYGFGWRTLIVRQRSAEVDEKKGDVDERVTKDLQGLVQVSFYIQ